MSRAVGTGEFFPAGRADTRFEVPRLFFNLEAGFFCDVCACVAEAVVLFSTIVTPLADTASDVNVKIRRREDKPTRLTHEVRWVVAAGGPDAVTKRGPKHIRVPRGRRGEPTTGAFGRGFSCDVLLPWRKSLGELVVQKCCCRPLVVHVCLSKGFRARCLKRGGGNEVEIGDAKAAVGFRKVGEHAGVVVGGGPGKVEKDPGQTIFEVGGELLRHFRCKARRRR